MLKDLFVYLFQYMPAVCTGIGIGLMLGTVIVSLGGANQYMKGKEDGHEQGMLVGYANGWNVGYDKGKEAMKASINYEGRKPNVLRKNNQIT